MTPKALADQLARCGLQFFKGDNKAYVVVRDDLRRAVVEALRRHAQRALPDQLELAQFLCSEIAAEPWDELSQPKYMADADLILAFLSSFTSTVPTPIENKEGGAA